MTGPDGRGYVPVRWLIGVGTVAVLGMIGAWALATHNDIEQLKAQQAVAATDHAILLRVESRLEDLNKKLDGLYRR